MRYAGAGAKHKSIVKVQTAMPFLFTNYGITL